MVPQNWRSSWCLNLINQRIHLIILQKLKSWSSACWTLVPCLLYRHSKRKDNKLYTPSDPWTMDWFHLNSKTFPANVCLEVLCHWFMSPTTGLCCIMQYLLCFHELNACLVCVLYCRSGMHAPSFVVQLTGVGSFCDAGLPCYLHVRILAWTKC